MKQHEALGALVKTVLVPGFFILLDLWDNLIVKGKEQVHDAMLI